MIVISDLLAAPILCNINFGMVPSSKHYRSNTIQMSLVQEQQRLPYWFRDYCTRNCKTWLWNIIHYFQFMHLHKEAFGAVVQTNVESITEHFKNLDAAVSSKCSVSSSGVHSVLSNEIELLNISIKNKGKLLGHSTHAILDIHTVTKSTKTVHIHSKMQRFHNWLRSW